LAEVRAEKAVLRMIAAESANFVTFDMVLSPSLFAAGVATTHLIRSTIGRLIPAVVKIGASLSNNFHHQLVKLVGNNFSPFGNGL
jgi:hypothetical protein